MPSSTLSSGLSRFPFRDDSSLSPYFSGVLLIAGIFLGTHLEGTRGDTLFGEGDTWWHIRAGEEILRAHAWPHTETYSFTAAGTDWIAYEWLGEVAMALAYRGGGLVGLKLLSLTLSGGMFLLLYIYATRRSGNCKAAFVVCAGVLPWRWPSGRCGRSCWATSCFWSR